jgi:D-3-phosphoglycerate dehydrogenase / 2-oxoglutarate reductase
VDISLCSRELLREDIMSTAKTVLVTCPPMLRQFESFRQAFERHGIEAHPADVVQTMTEAELIALVPLFDGWIIGDDPATSVVLSAGRKGKLRAIVKWGVGVDNVDFKCAEQLGLPATNTPGVFGKEVADLAMGYVIALARETFAIDRAIRFDNSWPKPAGISLAGKSVALVGFGDIGRNTARRLLASDMNVRVYDPQYTNNSDLAVEQGIWPEGLSDADFLVFTAPLTPQTHHMFNMDLLAKLKPGVRVVNVGRGPVISEKAMTAGLTQGIVHSAALDVFEIEPLTMDSPLRDFPLNIFGSHNASNTVDAVHRVSLQAIDLMAGFLK